jgi:hypothetical protein
MWKLARKYMNQFQPDVCLSYRYMLEETKSSCEWGNSLPS